MLKMMTKSFSRKTTEGRVNFWPSFISVDFNSDHTVFFKRMHILK